MSNLLYLNLLDLLDGLVDDLSFNADVFSSWNYFFLWNIFNLSFIGSSWLIISDIFNCLIVGNFGFSGDEFGSFNVFVFDDGSVFWYLFSFLDFIVFYNSFFVGDIFNSAGSLGSGLNLLNLYLLNNGLLNNLYGLLDYLNGLLDDLLYYRLLDYLLNYGLLNN